MKEKHEPKPGLNAEFGFTTRTGSHPSIQVNVKRELDHEQYLAALHRLKRIVESRKLKSVDSTAPGDKYTECNWGMCSDLKELWPTPELHIWPYDFLNRGRVANIDLGEHLCPMDTRTSGGAMGCFHTCRVFQRKHRTPNREQALTLIDEMILKYTNPEPVSPTT